MYYYSKISQACISLWNQHPALLYGLAFLFGISSVISQNIWLTIPITLLTLSCIGWRLVFALVLGLSGAFYAFVTFNFPEVPRKGFEGTAHISISSVSPAQTHFGKFWTYRGTLYNFQKDHAKTTPLNLPYSLSIPRKADFLRPPANASYVVKARLKQSKNGSYYLAVQKDTPWKAVPNTWSLAEWRFKAKRFATDYLQTHIFSDRAAKFLTGLTTGEFDDRLMVYEFSRFGLQHLMAISGFHFGIIAYLLGIFLMFLLPYRSSQIALILLLTLYCLFLGWAPSIIRSWITIVITLIGRLLVKESSALNSLGFALLFILILDPLAYQNLGFQFSFATTAGILLFYAPMHDLVEKMYPKRTLGQIQRYSLPSQHAYIVLAAFRTSLALGLAVTIVAMPMTLFIFHKFPLLSLLYNLFFPFLVSISMLFLLLGILWSWFPPVSQLFHTFNTYYTEAILNIAYELPRSYDILWTLPPLGSGWMILWLTGVFLFGLILKQLRQEEMQNFIF